MITPAKLNAFHLTSHGISCNSFSHPNPSEFQSFQDLFSFKKKGHLTKYTYLYHSKLDHFARIVHSKGYYLYQSDCALLAELHKFRGKLPAPETLVEIGPGFNDTVVNKSVPLALALNAKSYVALDISGFYANQASEIVGDTLRIPSSYIECDALKELPISHISGTKTIALIGGTLSNFSRNEISDLFSLFSQNMAAGDTFVTSVDTCSDGVKIAQAYNTAHLRELTLNTLRHYNHSIAKGTFNLNNWVSEFNWNADTLTAELYISSTSNQQVQIDTKVFNIPEGAKYMAIMSRKYQPDQYAEISKLHGLHLSNTISIPHNTMKFLVFTKT